MIILPNKPDYRRILESETAAQGFAAFAVMALAPPRSEELRQRLRAVPLSPELPEYILSSAELRRDPAAAFPWAKSMLMAAAPFSALPAPPLPLPRAQSPETAGVIAGYAARTDYHRHGSRLLEQLLQKLEATVARRFRFEICIDVKPLLERTLAEIAGLGRAGRNCCILRPGHGGGCFLVSAMLELELPDIPAECPPPPCATCGQCVKQCPNQVFAANDFKFSYCISALTMEKRGALTTEEMRRLGSQVFGCSVCTAACPDSSLPADFPLELEWLLLAPSAEVGRAIAATPLAHAGATQLRRNALAVLGNRNSAAARRLIEKFLARTGSRQLTTIGRQILSQS